MRTPTQIHAETREYQAVKEMQENSISQPAMEMLGLKFSQRLKTASVLCFAALSILLVATVMNQNSSSSHFFEVFAKGKILQGGLGRGEAPPPPPPPTPPPSNVTAKPDAMDGRAQNSSTHDAKQIISKINITGEAPPPPLNVTAKPDAMGGGAQNSSTHDAKQTISKTNITETAPGPRSDPSSSPIKNDSSNVTAKPDAMGGSAQNSSTHDAKQIISKINITETAPAPRSDPSSSPIKNDSSTHRPPSTGTSEQLLGGLLASRFDEESCLSRYQSYLLRKNSLHKPSPYLVSRLRAYEDLHRRCGPHTKSYKRIIGERPVKSSRRSSSRNTNDGENGKCNYIVWTAANGLGNRIVSMVSAFLYAVLTDRVLLVEFRDDMDGLFCEPFPNSSWVLPKHFKHQKLLRPNQTYESMLQRNFINPSGEHPPTILHLSLQHTREDPERFFHCDRSQSFLHKVVVLILQSDQYFVPSLFMTPSFQQELSRMFPEAETVFHHLAHYLLHPSNEAWGLITRFYQAYLSKADKRIGLQIRVFNPKATPHKTKMDQILACTLKQNLLPRVEDVKKEGAGPPRNQTSKAVLIASLFSEYTEELRNMYWTKPTVTGEVIGVYQPSHDEYQKFGDNAQNIKAWAEMYLLSLCDELVTSAQSTFGYVAQSLGGLKPWIMDRASTPSPPCKRALSMEPCFHFPPKYDCTAKTKLNIPSLFPHMRRCQDWSFGVKLIK